MARPRIALSISALFASAPSLVACSAPTEDAAASIDQGQTEKSGCFVDYQVPPAKHVALVIATDESSPAVGVLLDVFGRVRARQPSFTASFFFSGFSRHAPDGDDRLRPGKASPYLVGPHLFYTTDSFPYRNVKRTKVDAEAMDAKLIDLEVGLVERGYARPESLVFFSDSQATTACEAKQAVHGDLDRGHVFLTAHWKIADALELARAEIASAGEEPRPTPASVVAARLRASWDAMPDSYRKIVNIDARGIVPAPDLEEGLLDMLSDLATSGVAFVKPPAAAPERTRSVQAAEKVRPGETTSIVLPPAMGEAPVSASFVTVRVARGAAASATLTCLGRAGLVSLRDEGEETIIIGSVVVDRTAAPECAFTIVRTAGDEREVVAATMRTDVRASAVIAR